MSNEEIKVNSTPFLEAELSAQADALREARSAALEIEDPNLRAYCLEDIASTANEFIKMLMEEKSAG